MRQIYPINQTLSCLRERNHDLQARVHSLDDNQPPMEITTTSPGGSDGGPSAKQLLGEASDHATVIRTVTWDFGFLGLMIVSNDRI